MASVNFGSFGENWFKRPPNPFQPINLLSIAYSLNPFKPQNSKTLNFASISSSRPSTNPKPQEEEPGKYMKMYDQFEWESENLPNYRYAPEVEKILNEDPYFEKKENPTPEEVEENKQFWEDLRGSPVFQFLKKANEIADKLNEMELKANSTPFHREDAKYWKAIPHVKGPDGRPMPRSSLKTYEDANDKFWDFARQFFFGLWGFRQRPYPRFRPIDVAQSIGYKKLERRYYDFIMKTGGWYYKDRLGRTRGPMELIQLKTAWGGGIIDKNTFIWGEDMDEWAPICMIYGMEPAIATWEVKLGAAATAFLKKLQHGLPPWATLKGLEKKRYKQLQEEAYESKRRDLAVLQANDGVWPGMRIPSHTMFLWASGSELTSILEEDHMPNKFISKELRQKLLEVVPDLRPRDVLSLEQAMDIITYQGEWYREPLGMYRTGPPYIYDWNRDFERTIKNWCKLTRMLKNRMEDAIPGFNATLDKYFEESQQRKMRRQKAQMAREIAKGVAEMSAKAVQHKLAHDGKD